MNQYDGCIYFDLCGKTNFNQVACSCAKGCKKIVFGPMTFPSHQSGWQHPKDAHHE